jgi:hypothetical protein
MPLALATIEARKPTPSKKPPPAPKPPPPGAKIESDWNLDDSDSPPSGQSIPRLPTYGDGKIGPREKIWIKRENWHGDPSEDWMPEYKRARYNMEARFLRDNEQHDRTLRHNPAGLGLKDKIWVTKYEKLLQEHRVVAYTDEIHRVKNCKFGDGTTYAAKHQIKQRRKLQEQVIPELQQRLTDLRGRLPGKKTKEHRGKAG